MRVEVTPIQDLTVLEPLGVRQRRNIGVVGGDDVVHHQDAAARLVEGMLER
nr:hypothetical protein [Arthrobacter sp. MA-N2]